MFSTISPKEKESYDKARDIVDGSIKNSLGRIEGAINEIVDLRVKAQFRIFKLWLTEVSRIIPGIEHKFDKRETNKRLAKAIRHYVRYAFIYRHIERRDENISFIKIFSFEFAFKLRHAFLESTDPIIVTNPKTPTEYLMNHSMMYHFEAFRVAVEYYARTKNEKSEEALESLSENLFSLLTDFMLKSTTEIKRFEIISPDYMRKRIDEFPDQRIQKIFRQIDSGV
jgi:hypothetical protein